MDDNVAAVQRRLVALGYTIGASGPLKDGVDGDFGRLSAVAALAALETGKAAPKAPTSPPPVKQPDSPAASVDLVAAALVARQPKTSRSIKEIIYHCAATPEGRSVSVETIRGWHAERGWKDIGYHYVVLLDGTIAAGRPEAQVGAHVEGHNAGTLGICYVGGLAADGKTAKDTRTPAQKAALLAIGRALIKKYPTIAKVSGHNEYAQKACPSFNVRRDALGALVS
ncbi:N-acetylmuramoyl-L-alanine amidase [Chenggangzhangella methanolivorans]|uniref:N-acetylmuramoyl-L-alanine amidase n=1 Tax=Chenggangzhangella methanolivorans TaxID=1437009 RepID=A0A9E6R7U6_9HYPH|nr:N-acetylmuramoyl-L-alanine amidase [Chenggangzhangella methanolivorans]QZN99812.1 N-acetylmuramoyl-L-alanine amidase [Chenggangzhangella methanolivorans]